MAALAGLVSFLSPCILPLVPGYLSYVTGLAGADLDDALHRPTAAARGRVVVGTLGFIAGFTVVFTLTGVFAASVGRRCWYTYERLVEVVVGLLIIVLGLAFLGLVPGLQREWRIHRLPAAGLAGAPVLGAVFALVLGAVHRPDPRRGADAGRGRGLHRPGGDADRGVLPRPRAAVPRRSGSASAS